MSIKNLLDPIIEQGIRNTNFFEGRLLSGEDLRNQHNANRQHDRYLGQAIGQGIINGLEVELDNGRDGSDGRPPIVTVKKGLAINGDGEVMGLPDDDIKLALSRSIEKPTLEVADFYACAGPPGKQHIPNGTGVYILVMSPVAGYRERALKSGLGDEGVARGCGSKYIQEGVEFRLVELVPEILESISPETKNILREDLMSLNNPVQKGNFIRLSMLRNILAHICFGTEELQKCTATAYSNRKNGQQGYLSGAPGELYKLEKINSCDILLALFYWTLDGIAFVDNWSVRRLLSKKNNNERLANQFDETVADAMFFQFHDQMTELTKQTINNLRFSRTNAEQLFRYLPPVGAVAVSGSGSGAGLVVSEFFRNRQSGTPTVISCSQYSQIRDKASIYKPVELKSTDIIQLYWIRENIEIQTDVGSDQRYVYFSTREMHSFYETDDTQKTLYQTWMAYSDILRKQVLLPRSDVTDALSAKTVLQTDQQIIIQFAMTYDAMASSENLSRFSVFTVLHKLYTLQKTFTSDLVLSFDGDTELSQRESFASELNALLDNNDTGSGDPGLLPAYEKDDFRLLLKAQQAINAFVNRWSGTYIYGYISVRHSASPDGENLVPGSGTAFAFEYQIIGFIDKRSEVNLSASIINSPSGSWGNAVMIRDHDTQEPLSSITLNKLEQRVIDVLVTAPANAVVDEDVVLEVGASIAPPTDKGWKTELNLRTSSNAGNPVIWQLQLLNTQPGGEIRRFSVPPAPLRMNFMFQSLFIASQLPNSISATFIANFEFVNSDRSDWSISIPDQATAEISPGVFQFGIELVSGNDAISTIVSVGVPAGSSDEDRVCTMNVSLQAELIDPANGESVLISDEMDAPFAITKVAS